MLHRFWVSVQNDWINNVSWRNIYPYRIWSGVEILCNKLKIWPWLSEEVFHQTLISTKWDVRLPWSWLQLHWLLWVTLVPELKLSTRWTTWSQTNDGSCAVRVVGCTQFPAIQPDLSEHWLSRYSFWNSFAWSCTVTCLMTADHVYACSHVYMGTGRNSSDYTAQLLRLGSHSGLDSNNTAE